MDPLAHTLVGAALAKSGLETRSRFAAAALVIGANLPDVDGVTYFVSGELGLAFRRGWTHGIPAVLVWPFLLAGALVLFDRLFGKREARFMALLPLSLLAVATHPALDWLNNYGMRWLMPVDGRWFYGDAVFIVDPWIWLVLGGAVFLGTRRGAWAMLGFSVAGLLTTLLVLTGTPGMMPGKGLFLLGVAAFVFLRSKGVPRSVTSVRRWNRAAVAAVIVYIGALLATAVWAREKAREALEGQGIAVERLMVGPRPMTPFEKDVVVMTKESYRYGRLRLVPSPRLELAPEEIPRPQHGSLVARALERPEVRGFANWARFPWGEVTEVPGGQLVFLADARYLRGRAGGFGSASVFFER